MVRSRRGAAPGRPGTWLIRLFPDYAESVIWCPGPVPYEETGLSPSLLADLRDWDRSYDRGMADYDWRTPELEREFLDRAAPLAARLAREVGDEFEVEHDAPDGRRRVRGAGPAVNPVAAAAFGALAAAADAEAARLQQIVAQARRDGHTLEWRAYPPEGPPAT